MSLCLYLICFLCCRRRPAPVHHRPSSKGVIFVAIFAFLAIAVGAIAAWETGGKSFNTAMDSLDQAIVDLKRGQTAGTDIQTSCSSIVKVLGDLEASCPSMVQSKIKAELEPTITTVNKAIDLVKNYTDQIGPVVDKLEDVQKNEQDIGAFIGVTLAVPTALVGLSCFIIFAAVLVTRGCGGPEMARCNDCCFMRFGAIFITFCVFVAASVACVEAAYGTLSASFCSDADQNVINLSEHFFEANSTELRAVKYYLSGAGTNPYNETLTEAFKEIQIAKDDLAKELSSPIKLLIKASCKGDVDQSEQDVDKSIDDISKSIEGALNIVSRSNIFPYYKKFVEDDMCGEVIAATGCIVILQLIVGLIALPVLAMISHMFFARWASWKEREALGPEVYLVDTSLQQFE